jgi:glycosyltransferase involved in cell wall biosynthesis
MRSTPKILHAYKVFPPDLDGGIPSVIKTLCASKTLDFTNSILVARSRGLARTYESNSTPVEAVTSLGTVFSTPIAPTYPRVFLKRSNASDIAIHHAPFPLSDVIAPRIVSRVALIVYWHADITTYPLLKKLVAPSILKTLNRANRIIVSDASMIAASNLLISFKEKCSVVPYGSDLNFWSQCTEREEASARQLRQRHPRLIVAIGRLVRYKGFDSLVRALANVEGEVVIIGEGPLLHELKTLAQELGVSDRVFFEGRLEASEIKAYLYAARLLAFPSTTTAEAFGLVQLEAMAAGLPVVNTSLPTAVPNIARHEREGLTVPPNEPSRLANALNSILNDSDLATRFGTAAKARALSEYSQATYIARIEQIYQELLQERRDQIATRLE